MQGCRSGAWESQDVELAQKSEFIPCFRHPVHAKASLKLWGLRLLILEEIEPASSDWRCGFSDAWRSFNRFVTTGLGPRCTVSKRKEQTICETALFALQATLSSQRARPMETNGQRLRFCYSKTVAGRCLRLRWELHMKHSLEASSCKNSES